jgi:hypothetical protein
MKINEIKNYFNDRCDEIISLSERWRSMGFSLWVSGSKDLPLQMYVTLRCGIVHSFSLIPDATGKSKNGRPRSILLAHKMQGYIHLVASQNNELDSVIFTAEQFAKDIKETINIIFQKATTEKSLENQITEHVNNFPPIAGKNWIPSSI